MARSPEERPPLATQLDEVERGLKSFYRYFLYFLILLVTGFAIFLFFMFAHDANRAFLNLYGAVAYLVFLGWIVGQLRGLRPPPPSDLPDVDMKVDKDEETGAVRYSFHLGAPEREVASRPGALTFRFGTQLGSSPPSPGGSSPAAVAAWIALAAAVVALLLALWTFS